MCMHGRCANEESAFITQISALLFVKSAHPLSVPVDMTGGAWIHVVSIESKGIHSVLNCLV